MEPKVTANKRTLEQREADLVDVARLWCQGKGAPQIAAWLSANRPYTLSRIQVWHDIQKLIDRWREEETDLVAKRQWAEIGKLEYIFEQAMEGWEKSKRERVTKYQNSKEVDGVGGESKNLSVQVSISDGDPRFLTTAMQARQRICDILGVDAPKKSELTGAGGAPLEAGTVIILPDNGRGTQNQGEGAQAAPESTGGPSASQA